MSSTNNAMVPSLPPTNLTTTVTIHESPNSQQQVSNSHFELSQPVHIPYNAAIAAATVPQLENVTTSSASSTSQLKTAIPAARINTKSKRTFKVIIVGDAGVGKTCLSFRFCCGRFPEHTQATIGVDFRERALTVENEHLRVQLWDTAGQERYRQSIVAHYYRNVNAVVFVYDVTSKASFESLKVWLGECEKHGLGADADLPRILIGNKCDLASTSKVHTDTAQIFADQNNMALFETSAKADSEADHVESIFMTLVHKLQQSKPMHVQTENERQLREQDVLHVRAADADNLDADNGWCC